MEQQTIYGIMLAISPHGAQRFLLRKKQMLLPTDKKQAMLRGGATLDL